MKESLDAIKKQGIEEDLRNASASLATSTFFESPTALSVTTNRTAAEIIEYLDMADYTKVNYIIWCKCTCLLRIYMSIYDFSSHLKLLENVSHYHLLSCYIFFALFTLMLVL